MISIQTSSFFTRMSYDAVIVSDGNIMVICGCCLYSPWSALWEMLFRFSQRRSRVPGVGHAAGAVLTFHTSLLPPKPYWCALIHSIFCFASPVDIQSVVLLAQIHGYYDLDIRNWKIAFRTVCRYNKTCPRQKKMNQIPLMLRTLEGLLVWTKKNENIV